MQSYVNDIDLHNSYWLDQSLFFGGVRRWNIEKVKKKNKKKNTFVDRFCFRFKSNE